MTIDDKIRDKTLQYDINREAAKISALSSGKIDKYEYLIEEEILPSDQRWATEQSKCAYPLFVKHLKIKKIKKQKTIEDQREKLIKASEDVRNN